MYKPLSIFSIFSLFIYLCSCAPENYNTKDLNNNQSIEISKLFENKTIIEKNIFIKKNKKIKESNNINYLKSKLSSEIVFLTSQKDDPKVIKQFINVIEFAVYKKKLHNISFEIFKYKDTQELKNFLNEKATTGKIFFGPLSINDTKELKPFCKNGSIFFSFASNKDLAEDCIYLLNFFPENEIKTIFNYLPKNSKVALVHPENSYGYKISEIVNRISEKSESIIISRASYKENLINAGESIKELGKYELRKYELNRQKKLLALKQDKYSKNRLKKLERFTTTSDYDFTHVIIADYGLRLLQVAPLLAYYDIDPSIVKFVGTGAWDDPIFFNEPSLQGAIFPGIEYSKRKKLINEYKNYYDGQLLRISTLPYDLVGLLSYLIINDFNLGKFNKLFDNNIRFEGVDGGFYFKNNVIERELDILKIKNGKAIKLLK